MGSPDRAWLSQTEAEMAATGVQYEHRAWHAILKWASECGGLDRVSPEQSNTIFGWFSERTPQQDVMVGPLYAGLFMYLGRRWPVFVPLIYGRVRLNPIESLRTMPLEIRQRLCSEREAFMVYLNVWCDSFDYAYGVSDLWREEEPPSFAQQLLASGNHEVCAGATLAMEDRPNAKGAECFRMATEMLMKNFLVVRENLDEMRRY